MTTAVNSFKGQIAKTIQELTLHESGWGSTEWIKLYSPVNQEVLKEASTMHSQVRPLLDNIGPYTERPCKSIERVRIKMGEKNLNHFRPLCDFLAIRVNCDVTEIQGKIDRIRQTVLDHNGKMHVRGAKEDRPYGSFMDQNRKYEDITQYVYVYFPEVGYPLEIQVGHPFAAHTFKIDSMIRDDKNCGAVDLWDKGFYQDVKQYILDKANGVESTFTKEMLQAKALDIHSGEIPAGLQVILNKI